MKIDESAFDIITNSIEKFFIQEATVKNGIVDDLFKDKTYIKLETHQLYREGDLIAVTAHDVGYLCAWNGNYTIVLYKYKGQCKVKFFDKTTHVKTIFIDTDNELSIFTILMDYLEARNIIEYNNLYSNKLLNFYF